jgi:hypothetical protein
LWIYCLASEDKNSILQQLWSMMSDACVFRTIIEARRLAELDETGKPKLNGMVHHAINRWFFASQVASIRRQMDSTYGIDHPKRGVHSIASLVADIREHRHLLTRANLFGCARLSMNVEAIEQAEAEWMRQVALADSTSTAFFVPPECDPDPSKSLHQRIDLLCEVANAENRSSTDVVSERVFDAIQRRLDEINRIKDFATQFVAHSATPKSREERGTDDAGPTLGEIWRAHELLCRLCTIVDCYLIRGSTPCFVGASAFDVFQYIEVPFVPPEGVPELRQAWNAAHAQAETWSSTDLGWLLQP